MSISPVAADEIVEASLWLNEQSSGLGDALVDEVEHLVALLAEQPDLGQRVLLRRLPPDVRRVPLQRFRYILVYQVIGSTLKVLAVAHTSRQPGYWKNRL